MALSKAHARFAEWVDSVGSQREAADVLASSGEAVSATFLSDLVHGRRWPGRALANAIERATGMWEKKPIRSEEWDEAEREAAA